MSGGAPGAAHLHPGDRVLVGLVVRGLSNEQIAAVLGVTSDSVAQRVRRLMLRLGVSSRLGLATCVAAGAWHGHRGVDERPVG